MQCPRCTQEKHHSKFPNGSDTRKVMKKLFGDGTVICTVCWQDHKYINQRRQNDEFREIGKPCAKCGEVKRLEEFYYRSSSSGAKKSTTPSRHSYCKECSLAIAQLTATQDRANKLSYRYGISLADFEALAPHGCQICGAKRPDRTLVVDHDHDTGKFRGILCSQCNTAIGLLGDEPERIFKAFYYLDQRKNVQKTYA
jgi:Recombination endonuclease VII